MTYQLFRFIARANFVCFIKLIDIPEAIFSIKLPYMASVFRVENFFCGILANRKLNHLLCTVHDGIGLMHHESVTVFCAQHHQCFVHNHESFLIRIICRVRYVVPL